MRRQLLGAALGLLMVFGSVGTSAAEEGDKGMVLNGCVVVTADGSLVVTTGSTAAGPRGAAHNQDTYVVQIPEGSPVEGTVQNGCGAVAVYQVDGVWYAKSVTVTPNGDGSAQVQTTSVTGDGEGNATTEQQSGTWTPGNGPIRNR
jgi:hypothetical protein